MANETLADRVEHLEEQVDHLERRLDLFAPDMQVVELDDEEYRVNTNVELGYRLDVEDFLRAVRDSPDWKAVGHNVFDGDAFWDEAQAEMKARELDLDLADVYAALTYYHRNPEVICRVEKRRERLSEKAADTTTLTPPRE